MIDISRKITRTRPSPDCPAQTDYCTVEIELHNGRLSICGEAGRVETPKQAKQKALDSWIDYFEEYPTRIDDLNNRCNTRFRSPRTAAKHLLKVDGKYAGRGLFVDATERDGQVFISYAWGQCLDEMKSFFPEVKPLLPWHLNDMHSGCECSEALGWKHGKTIALTKDTCAPAQTEALARVANERCEKLRARAILDRTARLRYDRNFAIEMVKTVQTLEGRSSSCSVADLEEVMNQSTFYPTGLRKKVEKAIRHEVECQIKPEEFDAAIYKDCIGAPCPTCGCFYGERWYSRVLPPEIVELASTVLKDDPTCHED